MFDKLKFWKKEDSLAAPSLDPLPNDPMQHNPDPLAHAPPDPLSQSHDPLQSQDPFADPPGQGMQPPTASGEQYPSGTFSHVQQPHPEPDMSHGMDAMHQMSAPEHYEEPRNRDTELIIAKLDAIKHALDSMDQRIRQIEQKDNKRYW